MSVSFQLFAACFSFTKALMRLTSSSMRSPQSRPCWKRSFPVPFLQIPVELHDPRLDGWDFISANPGRGVLFSDSPTSEFWGSKLWKCHLRFNIDLVNLSCLDFVLSLEVKDSILKKKFQFNSCSSISMSSIFSREVFPCDRTGPVCRATAARYRSASNTFFRLASSLSWLLV